MRGLHRGKRLVCALCAAAVGIAASSCGKNEPEIQHIPIELPTRVSVSWWGNELRSDYTFQGIREYEQKHKDIDIVPNTGDFTGYKENLDTLMSCGKEPDIVMINSAWLPEYSPEGEGFADLYEYSDILKLSNFSEKELSYGTMNGRLNALPIALNAVTFYYNKGLLDSYGLQVPTTWEDFFDCAKAMSADGKYPLVSSYKHYWKMLIAREEQLTGREAFGSENWFTEENVASMFEFFKRLSDEKVIPPNEYEKSDFLDEKVACAVLWVSDGQFYVSPLAEEGGEVVIGDYPVEQDYKRYGWYLKPTSLYAISKNSRHPKEAAEFLDYLMNDSRMAELQGTEKGIPLSRSALETLGGRQMLSGVTYEAATKLNDSSDSFSLMPPLLEDNERINRFFEYYELYYYGRMTARDAAEIFVSKYPFRPSLRG